MDTTADPSEDRDMLDDAELPTTPEAELEQWRRQASEFEGKYLRALADYQNFHRRSLDNETKARLAGIAAVARSLIPAIDQLDLALGEGAGDADAIRRGVGLVRDEVRKALAAHGVEIVAPVIGGEFDPTSQEALLRQPAEGVAPDHVSAVFQPGWRLGEMVLRPAKVAVAPEA